jgi:hypothetical protein
MERAVPIPPTEAQLAAARAAGVEDLFDPDREVWRNNLYTVHVARSPLGYVTHLSIRRNDRAPIHDWRHFQRIKTELAGEDVEAVELYPHEGRLVDGANQYHLWVFPPGFVVPLGYDEGRAVDDSGGVPGAVQRPVPADWRSR